jgi:hypothetical protein
MMRGFLLEDDFSLSRLDHASTHGELHSYHLYNRWFSMRCIGLLCRFSGLAALIYDAEKSRSSLCRAPHRGAGEPRYPLGRGRGRTSFVKRVGNHKSQYSFP